jgi:hypothetical protein
VEEMRYAVNLKKRNVYIIDEGYNVLISAEEIYDSDQADQYILSQLGADVIVEAEDKESALQKAIDQHLSKK